MGLPCNKTAANRVSVSMKHRQKSRFCIMIVSMTLVLNHGPNLQKTLSCIWHDQSWCKMSHKYLASWPKGMTFFELVSRASDFNWMTQVLNSVLRFIERWNCKFVEIKFSRSWYLWESGSRFEQEISSGSTIHEDGSSAVPYRYGGSQSVRHHKFTGLSMKTF